MCATILHGMARSDLGGEAAAAEDRRVRWPSRLLPRTTASTRDWAAPFAEDVVGLLLLKVVALLLDEHFRLRQLLLLLPCDLIDLEFNLHLARAVRLLSFEEVGLRLGDLRGSLDERRLLLRGGCRLLSEQLRLLLCELRGGVGVGQPCDVPIATEGGTNKRARATITCVCCCMSACIWTCWRSFKLSYCSSALTTAGTGGSSSTSTASVDTPPSSWPSMCSDSSSAIEDCNTTWLWGLRTNSLVCTARHHSGRCRTSNVASHAVLPLDSYSAHLFAMLTTIGAIADTSSTTVKSGARGAKQCIL